MAIAMTMATPNFQLAALGLTAGAIALVAAPVTFARALLGWRLGWGESKQAD